MWRKRSGRIQTLRIALPGMIVLIIALILGWITVKSILNALNVYNPTSQDIRMTNLHFVDQTGSGDPYEVSGLEAIKKQGATSITLKSPVMIVNGNQSHPSHLQAVSGIYNDTAKTFHIDGHVAFSGGQAGMVLKTNQADVNLNTNIISGDHEVEMQWDRGSAHGQSFIISDNGNRVVINGKSGKRACGILNSAPRSTSLLRQVAPPTQDNSLCQPIVH